MAEIAKLDGTKKYYYADNGMEENMQKCTCPMRLEEDYNGIFHF